MVAAAARAALPAKMSATRWQGVTLGIFSDGLPCGFSVSGTLPKLCAVWKYEMQAVTLAIFSDSLHCGSESMTSRASLSPFSVK